MKRLAFIIAFLFAWPALADQGWQDNQFAGGFYLYDFPTAMAIKGGVTVSECQVGETTPFAYSPTLACSQMDQVYFAGPGAAGPTVLNALIVDLQSLSERAPADASSLAGSVPVDSYFFRGMPYLFNGGANTNTYGLSQFTVLPQAWTSTSALTASTCQDATFFVPSGMTNMTCGGTYGLRVVSGPTDTGILVDGTYQAAGLGGSGTRCVQVDNTGKLAIAAGACGTGTGTVTSVTGTAQRISVVNPTTTPVVDTIGGYYSGAVSGGNEDLGTSLTNGAVCDTTSAGVASLHTCSIGTEVAPVGACGTNQFATATNASTLTCVQPSFSNLSGTAACGQITLGAGLACSTGTYDQSIPSSATTTFCAGKITTALGADNYGRTVSATCVDAIGKVWVDGADAANNVPDYLASKIVSSSTINISPIGSHDQQLQVSIPSSVLVQRFNLIYNLQDYVDTGGFGALWLISGPTNTGNSDGSATEYPSGLIGTFVRVMARVSLNTLAGGIGSGPTVMQVTRNGSNVTGAFISIPLATTGNFDSGLIAVTSSSAADTYGLFPSGSSPNGGVITANISLIVLGT